MHSLTFNDLVHKLREKDVYMIIGNGSKNQFKNMRKVEGILKDIVKTSNKNSAFLYFGDAANEKKPDVGLLFKLIHSYDTSIPIYMIQIAEAKSWGVPKFVKGVYWHRDYTKECKWGGIFKGKPCSNTKKWISLNRRLKNGIRKVFIFGGGPITLDEYKLIKKYRIPYEYFPVERKFDGDGKSKIKTNASNRTKVGITWNKI